MKAQGSVIILAEDRSGARFVEAWLRGRGVPSRAMVTKMAPEGSGSGKQWVTAEYPKEVRDHRSKVQHTEKTLIVCTDADELSVNERLDQLGQALTGARLEERDDEERILLLVPRWEIETWAHHLLSGDEVTEDEKAVHWDTERSRRDCRAAGERWDTHRPLGKVMPGCCPPSLVRADDERKRLDRDEG
ncbi:MAG: hypothetical protein U0326_34780 [Polyangiales bacterium]